MSSALIGAFVSFVIFIFTQWFLSVRGRSDFLRGKLEELFLSFDLIITLSRVLKPSAQISSGHSSAYVLISEDAGKMVEALQKPLMFCTLYFPDITPRLTEVICRVGDLNQYMHDIAQGKVVATKSDVINKSKPVRDAIETVRDYIREHYHEHIKTPAVVAKSWLCN
jgi:hypothetical protein